MTCNDVDEIEAPDLIDNSDYDEFENDQDSEDEEDSNDDKDSVDDDDAEHDEDCVTDVAVGNRLEVNTMATVSKFLLLMPHNVTNFVCVFPCSVIGCTGPPALPGILRTRPARLLEWARRTDCGLLLARSPPRPHWGQPRRSSYTTGPPDGRAGAGAGAVSATRPPSATPLPPAPPSAPPTCGRGWCRRAGTVCRIASGARGCNGCGGDCTFSPKNPGFLRNSENFSDFLRIIQNF
jgi:hypothetical protein